MKRTAVIRSPDPAEPSLWEVAREGRKPYYEVRFGKQTHYLGTNRHDARRKYLERLEEHALADESLEQQLARPPRSVSGVLMRWQHEFPRRFIDYCHAPFLEFARGTLLRDVGADYLDRYCDHLKAKDYAVGTVIKYVAYAQRVLRWAWEREWIDRPPRRPSNMPKAAFNPNEIQASIRKKVIAQFPEQAKPILTFLLETGCRPGEACGLKWEHIDLDRGVCTIGEHKNAMKGKVRTLYLTPAARVILEAQPDDDEYVFVNRLGRAYKPNGLRSIMYRIGEKLDVHLTTYQMRHTSIQHNLDAGMPEHIVAGLAGHADTRTVRNYAKVKDRDLIDAASGASSPAQVDPRARRRDAKRRHPDRKAKSKPRDTAKQSRRKSSTAHRRSA